MADARDVELADPGAPARQRRDEAADRLDGLSDAIAATAAAMARRFASGATLHPMGQGASAIDADHVTVEFIHPVIVGKRGLPALTLAPGELSLARDDSIVLGLRLGDDPDTTSALANAAARGALTIDLSARGTHPDAAGTDQVSHHLVLDVGDPFVARELEVTIYHVLWELTHEFLDAENSTTEAAPDGLANLYPFLYDRSGSEPTDVTAHAVASTRSKAAEITGLRHQVLTAEAERLGEVGGLLADAARRGATIWTFGNGGSSTDAQAVAHLLAAGELAGNAVPARALTRDVATITALANDVSFDVTFARMLRSLARPGDVAIGLSTSGGSANVLAALEAASGLGATTIGLAGYNGGDMANLDALDHLFVVPSSSVHRIQEAQTTLAHVLIETARANA